MASPSYRDQRGRCVVCGDRLKKPQTQHGKVYCQHMSNNKCSTTGSYVEEDTGREARIVSQ